MGDPYLSLLFPDVKFLFALLHVTISNQGVQLFLRWWVGIFMDFTTPL